jgi:hypothetical protein
MDRAAGDEAAGGRAAMTAECATDPGTMARVAASLLGQLGGTMPVIVREHASAPGASLDRRTSTPLRWIREATAGRRAAALQSGPDHCEDVRRRELLERHPDLQIQQPHGGFWDAAWLEPDGPCRISASDLGLLLNRLEPLLSARASGRGAR